VLSDFALSLRVRIKNNKRKMNREKEEKEEIKEARVNK
jgi:hypothetical protein